MTAVAEAAATRGERPLRRILLATVLVCALAAPAWAQEIRGSGSTFAFPLMTKWIEAYEKAGGGRIVYRPTGSAAGLNDIRHNIVDFAVSEAPLDGAQLLRDGLSSFRWSSAPSCRSSTSMEFRRASFALAARCSPTSSSAR